MRRVAVLTLLPALALVAGGCRHDGRTLRPARPDQNQSISTSSAPGTTDPSDTDAVGTDAPAGSTGGTGSTGGSTPASGDDTGSLPLNDEDYQVTAPWADGGTIPDKYTCDGANVSPALTWSPAPKGTVEIAITMDDLDAKFDHWGIAGLRPTLTSLGEAEVPLGAYEAANGSGQNGYSGPCPPAGSTHEYVITVHYLAAATDLSDGVTNSELVDGISVAEIASAQVSGSFGRP